MSNRTVEKISLVWERTVYAWLCSHSVELFGGRSRPLREKVLQNYTRIVRISFSLLPVLRFLRTFFHLFFFLVIRAVSLMTTHRATLYLLLHTHRQYCKQNGITISLVTRHPTRVSNPHTSRHSSLSSKQNRRTHFLPLLQENFDLSISSTYIPRLKSRYTNLITTVNRVITNF